MSLVNVAFVQNMISRQFLCQRAFLVGPQEPNIAMHSRLATEVVAARSKARLLRQICLALLLLALFAVALLYQRPTLIVPLNIYDEGIIVFGATRIMNGQVPYRDFWEHLSEIGSDTWTMSSVRIPSLLLDGVTISGA